MADPTAEAPRPASDAPTGYTDPVVDEMTHPVDAPVAGRQHAAQLPELTDLTPDALAGAIEFAAAIVAGVRPEQYELGTPNPGMDVRALLNHLVSGNLMFASSARREPFDPTAFRADFVVTDPPGAYRDAAETGLAAWRQPGAVEGTAAFGDFPARLVLGIYFLEELLHGWDLAVATGQPAALPAELCALGLAVARRLPPDQCRQPSVFGPEIAVPADAPIADRLLAFTGRNPRAGG
jgi:uncharacterized protein (TIGR03086 family)